MRPRCVGHRIKQRIKPMLYLVSVLENQKAEVDFVSIEGILKCANARPQQIVGRFDQGSFRQLGAGSLT
ncbi:hypothetical protein ES703_76686 [subsurface metagenome]